MIYAPISIVDTKFARIFTQKTLFFVELLLQIFELFDVKRKGVIDFGDFVRSLNVFHPNASQEDKINCKAQIMPP